jgi:hypothetical protein
MTRMPCSALMPDGRRCHHAAAPHGLFCPGHTPHPPDSEAARTTAAGLEPFSSPALRQWLLGVLQAEMLALCAADLPPLDRANAISDLGELFLQALPSGEEIDSRIAELEVRTSDVERQMDRW